MKDTELFFDMIGQNNIAGIKKFIANGFDVNQKNRFGSSAMHIAICENFVNLTELLISSGINVNAQNNEGKTGLHHVAEYNRVELGKMLLREGADLAIADNYGNQPLWTAVFNDKGRNDRVDLVRLFIQHGANTGHKNNVGKSPKDIVVIAGYKNLEELLLRN